MTVIFGILIFWTIGLLAGILGWLFSDDEDVLNDNIF